MKLIRISLITGMTFISLLASSEMKIEKTILTFSEKDFNFSYNDSEQLTIGTNLLASYPETNEPALPLFSIDLVIPSGYQYHSAEVEFKKRLLKDNVTIIQSPTPVITDSINNIKSTQNIKYLKDQTYPTSNCKYVATSDWNEVKTLHFLSSPFIYNAEERKLYFIDSIELSINLLRDLDKATKLNYVNQSPFLETFVTNSEKIRNLAQNSNNPYTYARKVEYLIVTNQSLKSSFEPLLNWKKTKGLFSDIITIEEIESKYSGTSSQLKLKKYLYELYSTNSLKYVLLGGDDTIIPVQGCYGIVNNNKDYEDFTIPTDLYYACFNGNFNWDGNGNGIYGETGDNVDLAQHIYVTRVPVRSTTDVESFVSKLLDYETNPIWTNDILMCGTLLWENYSHSKSDAEAKGDNLYDNFIKPYWSGKRHKFYDTYTNFPGNETYDFTSTNLSQQISKGYAFIDVITHGSQTTWSMEAGTSYNSYNGIAQKNPNNTIVTTMACLTNAFDSSNKGGRQDPCLSESFIRNPSSGIIAYLGCSRYGWGYSGGTKDLGMSLQYESIFFKNLFSSSIIDKNFGVLVASAKAAMISKSSTDGAYRWIQYGLNPIGDPEMPIFINKPKTFNNQVIDISNTNLSVSSGENSRICISGSDNVMFSFYNSYKDIASVPFSILPIYFDVCVTKQDYIPRIYNFFLLQNETLTGTNVYSKDFIKIGSYVTSKKIKGDVKIQSGETIVNASTIVIDNGIIIDKNAKFTLNNN